MKHGIVVFLIAFLAIFSPAEAELQTVRVAAAANLGGVFKELETALKAGHPGISLEVVFGSSGKLAAQIMNGASFDLFLSADMETPQKLADRGLAEMTTGYAEGRLIIFTTRELPMEQGIGVVALPQVRRVAVANPALAPYGRAAMEALGNSGLSEAAKGKIIYAGNVSEAAHFAVTAADAGFIALSLLQTAGLKKYDRQGKYWQEVDPRLHAPIKQGMALLSRRGKGPGARIVYEFILSPDAREIFARNGYR